MKVIVTGGCGYIGSHVARAFKLNGDEVLIIDRVKREHTLKDIDGYYIGDFANDDTLATMVDFNPNVIVHCAGTSLVSPSMSNPSEYYNNNVTKTIRMMDVIKDLDRKPIIMFSSSASVYGEPDVLPITENAKLQPMSPYGSTKLTGEMILKDYGNAYGIDVMCFRYFNAAGACPITHDLGQESGATHIVARVLEASLVKKAFTINGDNFDTPDGTCIRDYVHVWDIALAHVRAASFFPMMAGKVLPDTRTSICMSLNLGTNTGVSNKEIVDYVFEKYGLSHVNYGPMRFGDPAKLVADATEARRLLGWEPVNSNIKQIIDDAYKWYTRT